ncbi:pseudouridine synthase, partial [Vibrio parahaemolyticus]|nr:pseudouridine synthase [Vibrio parahaemolyticus]
ASVPGKDAVQPSVYALMRRKYQEATGPLIVHRLDMATSGLMIVAKTEFAYHRLQKEFLNHRVQKKYVAIVCGKDKESCNRILKEA